MKGPIRAGVLAGLAILLAWSLIARRQRAPEPLVSEPPLGVAAASMREFRAELLSPEGGRLSVRLTPKHARASLQAKDAEQLSKLLDLPDGELWQLELRWASLPSEDRGKSEQALLPGALQVVDAAGQALLPIDPDRAQAGPLAQLLASPRSALFPGQSLILPLWGRPPGENVKLLGLQAPSGKEFRFDASVALNPELLDCAELPRFLARVDPAETSTETSTENPPKNPEAKPLGISIRGDAQQGASEGDH